MRFSDKLTNILLPGRQFQIMVEHCRRKLEGRYLAHEMEEPKAFGLLGGRVDHQCVSIAHVIPLLKNARRELEKSFMDDTMAAHAVPSETPLKQRGWVAASDEIDSALFCLQDRGMRMVGTYHMHRLAWDHDKIRDTPTELDTVLGRQSRMFMFIISMVAPDKPLIRAFFEGNPAQELPIVIS
ncbi:hypothetical protein ACOHYD_07100 [Desulfobacterota bacterium M19]